MVSQRLNNVLLVAMLSLVSVSLGMPKASSPKKQPHRYPPPETCDVCDTFQNGIDNTKQLLESIKEKAQKAPECNAEITVVTGPLSGTGDKDPSTVDCPVGTTIINCRCSVESDECEGVSTTGRTCIALKGMNSAIGIKAVATCIPSCTGTFVIAQAPLVGLQAGKPVATCPINTEIVNCFVYGFNTISGYHFPSINVVTRSCEPVTTCPAGGCSVKALCKAV